MNEKYTVDLDAIKVILKGVLEASKNGYKYPRVAIVTPQGHSGTYNLDSFGEHHVKVKSKNDAVLFFPIIYVHYAIAMSQEPVD